MASKSQNGGGTTTTSSSSGSSGNAMGIVGAVLGFLASGANTAMTWVLGEKQLEVNEKIATANALAQQKVALAQAQQKAKTANTLAIYGLVIILIILALITSK